MFRLFKLLLKYFFFIKNRIVEITLWFHNIRLKWDYSKKHNVILKEIITLSISFFNLILFIDTIIIRFIVFIIINIYVEILFSVYNWRYLENYNSSVKFFFNVVDHSFNFIFFLVESIYILIDSVCLDLYCLVKYVFKWWFFFKKKHPLVDYWSKITKKWFFIGYYFFFFLLIMIHSSHVLHVFRKIGMTFFLVHFIGKWAVRNMEYQYETRKFSRIMSLVWPLLLIGIFCLLWIPYYEIVANFDEVTRIFTIKGHIYLIETASRWRMHRKIWQTNFLWFCFLDILPEVVFKFYPFILKVYKFFRWFKI